MNYGVYKADNALQPLNIIVTNNSHSVKVNAYDWYQELYIHYPA